MGVRRSEATNACPHTFRARGGAQRRACVLAVVEFRGSALLYSALLCCALLCCAVLSSLRACRLLECSTLTQPKCSFQEYFKAAYGGGGGGLSLSWVHSRGSMVVSSPAGVAKNLSTLQGLALLLCSKREQVSFKELTMLLGGPAEGLLKRELHPLVVSKRPLLKRTMGDGIGLIGPEDAFECRVRWRLTKWEAVGLVSIRDVCILCGRGLLSLCTKCAAAGVTATGTSCVVAVGECGHTFHNCCVRDWLGTNDHCPLGQHKFCFRGAGAGDLM